MKKLMMVLLSLMVVIFFSGCSNSPDNSKPENNINLVSSSMNATDQPDRPVNDFNPEEYDVILRDSDNWYLLMNHRGTTGYNRTYTYLGHLYVRAGNIEYWEDAWMVYDETIQTLSIGLESPYDNDILQYTMLYVDWVYGGYNFDGSYGWRNYRYGARIYMELVQGSLGSLTADGIQDDFNFNEATAKTKSKVID